MVHPCSSDEQLWKRSFEHLSLLCLSAQLDNYQMLSSGHGKLHPTLKSRTDHKFRRPIHDIFYIHVASSYSLQLVAKGSVYIRKDQFGTPTWTPFYFLWTPTWRTSFGGRHVKRLSLFCQQIISPKSVVIWTKRSFSAKLFISMLDIVEYYPKIV